MGWPANIWAPSSSPDITLSNKIFQFACASSLTSSPSSSKNSFSFAITKGAQSVSLMKPNISSSFSTSSSSAVTVDRILAKAISIKRRNGTRFVNFMAFFVDILRTWKDCFLVIIVLVFMFISFLFS